MRQVLDPVIHTKPIVNILLVEDSKSDVILTRVALDKLKIPYQVSVLNQGSKVMPYLKDNDNPKPDLILLDLGLPDGTGFDVLEDMAAQPVKYREIPIVILTGYDNFSYIRQMPSLLIKDYIYKPCKPPEMLRAIQVAVDQAVNVQ